MRPDIGSVGKKCHLLSNHFRLSDIPDTKIYQYAIDIVIEVAPAVTNHLAEIRNPVILCRLVRFMAQGTAKTPWLSCKALHLARSLQIVLFLFAACVVDLARAAVLVCLLS